MDECVAVAVAEAVAVAVTEAVAEADQSIHDQSIHDPSIHPRSIHEPWPRPAGRRSGVHIGPHTGGAHGGPTGTHRGRGGGGDRKNTLRPFFPKGLKNHPGVLEINQNTSLNNFRKGRKKLLETAPEPRGSTNRR